MRTPGCSVPGHLGRLEEEPLPRKCPLVKLWEMLAVEQHSATVLLSYTMLLYYCMSQQRWYFAYFILILWFEQMTSILWNTNMVPKIWSHLFSPISLLPRLLPDRQVPWASDLLSVYHFLFSFTQSLVYCGYSLSIVGPFTNTFWNCSVSIHRIHSPLLKQIQRLQWVGVP